MDITLKINGFPVTAAFPDSDIRLIWLPLLKTLSQLYHTRKRRIAVFLAGPPAAGKSTAASFLEYLSLNTPDLEPVQALCMDGFHFPQKYLLSHTLLRDNRTVSMASVKGCPQTYDTDEFKRYLCMLKETKCRWPDYDRTLHDVIADRLEVEQNIVLIDGNWLLLPFEPWRSIADELCDYSIFFSTDEQLLRDRLIKRKISGGLTPQEAADFYRDSDEPNVKLALAGHRKADLELLWDPADNSAKRLT